MLNFFKGKFIIAILLLTACNAKKKELNITNKDLSLKNGVMSFQDKPYTGMVYSKINTQLSYKVVYKQGKKHGKEERFFFNGKIAVSGFYVNGKKSGKHQSWWSNGKPKLIHNYNVSGNYSGTQREWLSNGQLVKENNYNNGEKDGWQKSWDVNGKINSNYIVINGEAFGLIGYDKCKSGDYVD